jgi:hypothetical protein
MHVKVVPQYMRPEASVCYIVGNSTFYKNLVSTEKKLYAQFMIRDKFKDIDIQTIRKRTSKTELFEYLISGTSSIKNCGTFHEKSKI